MEFCSEGNLRNFIDKNIGNETLIKENIISNIIKQICIGIKEIHNLKIVHRDLKPENIFMNKNMNINIGDFGISKQLSSYKEYTKTTKKIGSENYAAPEIKYKGIYNEKSDIWSLGCIIYELLTLNIYSKDKFMNEIKQINSNIYNNKWKELINLLLQIDYNKRLDINQVYNILEENIKINNKEENNIIIIVIQNIINIHIIYFILDFFN